MLDLRVDYSSKHLAVCPNNDNYMFSNISASSKTGFFNQWAMAQLIGHRKFCGGPQNYSKNWLLGSKESYFSYIYWRIDKNRGLRCADQGKKRSSRAKELFFGDLGKNRSLRC